MRWSAKWLKSWPKSAPDYQWPELYGSPWLAVLRWSLAGAFHVGYAAGLLTSLTRRKVTPVLVIRTDGIGDALLFEPALETLGQALSPHPIHLWAPRPTIEALAAVPVIDRKFTIPRGFKGGNLKYFKSPLWRARMGFRMGMCVYDKVVYPVDSPEPLGNWLLTSVRAVERWINYGDTENQFEWQRQRAQEKASFIIAKRPGSSHDLLRNAYLATQWSGKLRVRKPKVFLSDRAARSAERQMKIWQHKANDADASEIIGVIASASMNIKDYPLGKWVAGLTTLWNQRQAIPALIGGPTDVRKLDELGTGLRQAGVPYLRMDSPLPVLGCAALLKHLAGVISVDTGLAHMSIAMELPTVVLAGGGHPGRFFPWPRADNHRTLNVKMECDGCRNRCTQAEAFCITHISPDEIVAAYGKLKSRDVPLQMFPTWTTPLAATG